MTNPAAYKLDTPYELDTALDVDDARTAARKLALERRGAEKWHRELTEESADAERNFRKGLSQAFLAPVPEGTTAAAREAKARADVADLAYERDLKAGMVKVASERLRGLEGERAMLRALIEWSQRLRLDERMPA